MSNKPIKVLTEEGLRVLWNQISLDDYPNNDLLIAVLDGIDATKADKAEVASQDVVVLSEAQKYADDLNVAIAERISSLESSSANYALASELVNAVLKIEANEEAIAANSEAIKALVPITSEEIHALFA